MLRFPQLLITTGTIFALQAAAIGQIAIVGDLTHDRESRPGETYAGFFFVRNEGSEPAEVKLYQTDYMFFSDGSNTYGEPGSVPRSNAHWISFSLDRMTVPGKGSVRVEFTVNVPGDTAGAALAGSYWSMVMVEGIPKGSMESSLAPPSRGELGIRQKLRYGIQVATHIAGTGQRSVQFLDARVIKQDDGERRLQVDIRNTGERWIRPEVYVELFDNNGVSKGRLPGSLFRMYPGTSVRQRISLPTLPPGDYRAMVVVDAGDEDAFGAQYTITF